MYPNFHNSISNIKGTSKGSSSPFFFARVNDILLSPKTKTENFFEDAKGWVGLGYIKFTPIGIKPDINNPSTLMARPLFTNIIQYPLLNEIVMILSSPSYDLNEDPQSQTYYYISTVGLWNSTHHNAMPEIANYKGGELDFGNTFKEKENLRNLLPEEGDLLLEGRWGNSIRFSSTTPNKTINNPWSTQGEIGSPITIIRNKQSNFDLNPDPWVPTYEDINNDGSSIYLCSGQDIPLELASKNLSSFGVTVGSAFNSALQIPDPILRTDEQSPISADKIS